MIRTLMQCTRDDLGIWEAAVPDLPPRSQSSIPLGCTHIDFCDAEQV